MTQEFSTAYQLPIDYQISAHDEASAFLDDSRNGYYAICTRPKGGKFRQRLMPLHTLPFVLERHTQSVEKYHQANGQIDTWISQAVFVGWKNNQNQTVSFRKKSTLASIATLFVDIDYYNDEALKNLSPERINELLLKRCDTLGIPYPSVVIDSGKGVQAKWFHEPMPRKALTRWEACSSHLVNSLSSIGADVQVRDATRILRVLHTVNQKTGKLVRVIWSNTKQNQLVSYKFNDLCNAILPYTQEQIREFRAQKNQPKLDTVQKSAVVHFNCATGFSLRSQNWARFTDLQALLKLRNYDMGDGLREPLAFYLANQYALCHQGNHADPNQFHEILRVVKDAHKAIEHSTAMEKASRIHKLMKLAATGEVRSYGGKGFTPLYTPKNDTLINMFGITDNEMQYMSSIISGSEKLKRHADNRRNKNRAAGAVSRAEYEANSISKLKPWEQLGMSRAKWYRLGKPSSETSIDS